MGHYTQLKLDVVLAHTTPAPVIEELKRMCKGDGIRAWILTGDSAYFDDYEPPTLDFAGVDGFRLRVCCSLKNYEGEIEWFLCWIAPYVVTTRQCGHIQDEQHDPNPIRFSEGRWMSMATDAPPHSHITAEQALKNAAASPLERPLFED
jgi:hypothetical protein